MILMLQGAQLWLFAAMVCGLIVVFWAIGAVGRSQRSWEEGLAAALPCQRPHLEVPAAEPETVVYGPVPLDMLQEAIVIVERAQAAAWQHDPVLSGRLAAMEIERLTAQAEQRMGRLYR